MGNELKRVQPAGVRVRVRDERRYREALADGQQAIDDTLSGRRSPLDGAVGLGAALLRAYISSNAPACGACGEQPAGRGGLCEGCGKRKRLK